MTKQDWLILIWWELGAIAIPTLGVVGYLVGWWELI